MKLTNSQEEYIKIIYILEKNTEKVRVTDIATKLSITKPSVNKAINVLKSLELLNYETYGNITLTKQGETKAKEIIKKQDILKLFLVEVLEINCIQAEKESTSMKHAISEDTIKKLDQYIAKVLNLGDLECGYDKNNEKCKHCVRVTARDRLKNDKEMNK